MKKDEIIFKLKNLKRYDIGATEQYGDPFLDVEEDDKLGDWIKVEDIDKLINVISETL